MEFQIFFHNLGQIFRELRSHAREEFRVCIYNATSHMIIPFHVFILTLTVISEVQEVKYSNYIVIYLSLFELITIKQKKTFAESLLKCIF